MTGGAGLWSTQYSDTHPSETKSEVHIDTLFAGTKPSAFNYEQTIFQVRGAQQKADKNAAPRTEILPILDIFRSV